MTNREDFLLNTKFTTEGADQTAAAVENIAGSVKNAQKGVVQVSDTTDKVTNKLKLNFNAIESGLSKIGLGESVSKIGGLAQLADILNDVGDQSGVVKDLAGGFQSLIPGLTPAAAGIAAIAVPVAAIAAIGLAAGLALQAFNEALADNAEAVRLSIAGLEEDTKIKIGNITAQRTRTAEDNRQQAQDELDAIKLVEEQIAAIRIRRAAVEAEYAALGSSLNPQRRSELGEEGKQLDAELERLTGQFNSMSKEFQNTVTVLGPVIDARTEEENAIRNQAKATELATKAAEDHADAQKKAGDELAKNVKELVSVTLEIGKVTLARNAQLAQRVQDDRRAAEVGALEDAIARAQAQETASEQGKRLQQIQQTYMQNELKALAEYQKAESRATEDYSKNRIRKISDLYQNLNDIAASRDVAAFVTTRRNGLTDIARGDEDAGTASRRRREDYEAAATQRQAQFQAQLAQEAAAGNAQLKQSERLQQQLARLRETYAAQDLAAKRRSEDDAYRVQIGGLVQRQRAIASVVVNSINPAVTGIAQFATAAVNLYNQLRNAMTYSGGGGSSSRPTANYIPNYAPGGGVNVNISQLAVGELVTPTQLNGAVRTIVGGISAATGRPY